MTHGKTYNKSPRRINHKATRSKTNTGTTALERLVEQTTGGGVFGITEIQYFTGIYRNPILITEIQLYYQVYHDLCKFRHI